MSAGALILALVAVTLAAWLGLEAYLIATGRPTITAKIQQWNRQTEGFVALLFGLVAGLLGAHFFWCVC